MTKKTKQHRKYEQLALRLSLKLTEVAKKVSANLLNLLMAQKAVYIATFERKSDEASILNLLFGRPKQAVHG